MLGETANAQTYDADRDLHGLVEWGGDDTTPVTNVSVVGVGSVADTPLKSRAGRLGDGFTLGNSFTVDLEPRESVARTPRRSST